jgi:hypothetical protein
MDEFARLMSMEGVRPLGQIKERTRGRGEEPVPNSPQHTIEASARKPGDHVWVTGPRARTALDTALERLAIEVRDGRRGWAVGIGQDGRSVTLPAASGAASLLGAADRESLRIMVIGGDGWTFVLHPLMGVATLDEDPGGSD